MSAEFSEGEVDIGLDEDQADTAQEDAKAESASGDGRPKRRKRQPRQFPVMSFSEASALGKAILTHGAGQPIRRTTLFEALDRSPDSGATRALVTASRQYGLTTGAYNADELGLTPDGLRALDPSSSAVAQAQSRFTLAIDEIAPFKAIHEKYAGSRLPAVAVLRDAAAEAGVPAEQVNACVETFLANARDVGLIRNIGGSERLLTLDDLLDLVPDDSGAREDAKDVHARKAAQEEDDDSDGSEDDGELSWIAQPRPATVSRTVSPASGSDLSTTVFIISPIGAGTSEERKHANLVLESLIAPAVQDLGLNPVRADKISKPGMITGQVLDHLVRAPLVIADLSYGNPNVYYELGLRHALRKPVVQLIRASDHLPFDVGQFRTVMMDMSDIYVFVPQIELIRQEIARQCRAAMTAGQEDPDNPISRFYPAFWDSTTSN